MSPRILAWFAALVLVLVTGSLLLGRAKESRAQPFPSYPLEVRNIEIVNACPDPVWIFFGRAPPLRPWDAVNLNAGALASTAMLTGDVVWLLDETGEILGYAIVDDQTEQIAIDESCQSIVSRASGVEAA